MTEASAPDGVRLPVLPLVVATYSVMASNVVLFLATVWPIIVVEVVLDLVLILVVGQEAPNSGEFKGFISTVVGVPFNVAWTRRVLGHDAATGLGVLVWDHVAWRLFKFVLLTMVLFLPLLLPWTVLLIAIDDLLTTSLLLFVGFAALVYMTLRLFLGPPIAVMEEGNALFQSWKLTRGRVLPILLGGVILVLVPNVPLFFLGAQWAAVMKEVGGPLGVLLGSPIEALFSYVGAAFLITYSALVYGVVTSPRPSISASD